MAAWGQVSGDCLCWSVGTGVGWDRREKAAYGTQSYINPFYMQIIEHHPSHPIPPDAPAGDLELELGGCLVCLPSPAQLLPQLPGCHHLLQQAERAKEEGVAEYILCCNAQEGGNNKAGRGLDYITGRGGLTNAGGRYANLKSPSPACSRSPHRVAAKRLTLGWTCLQRPRANDHTPCPASGLLGHLHVTCDYVNTGGAYGRWRTPYIVCVRKEVN